MTVMLDFLQKSLNTKTFKPTTEESYFNKADVIKKLMAPIDASKSSSRSRDKISFADDLSGFTLY